jgi:hypothetical protein
MLYIKSDYNIQTRNLEEILWNLVRSGRRIRAGIQFKIMI